MKIVIAAAAALALSIPNIFATSQDDARSKKLRTITSNTPPVKYVRELMGL